MWFLATQHNPIQFGEYGLIEAKVSHLPWRHNYFTAVASSLSLSLRQPFPATWHYRSSHTEGLICSSRVPEQVSFVRLDECQFNQLAATWQKPVPRCVCVEGVSCAEPRRQSSTLGNSSFANHSLANEDPAVGEGRLGVKKNILMMKPFGRCQLERILLQPAIMRDTVYTL